MTTGFFDASIYQLRFKGILNSMNSEKIKIIDYDPAWPDHFDSEKNKLKSILKGKPVIEHIGSTAVPGISAKPIIDIMVGIPSLNLFKNSIKMLQNEGYTYVPDYETVIPHRRFFYKSVEQVNTVHLHVVEIISEFWKRHLLFRDILREKPEVAKQYHKLKFKLAKKFQTDREAYTKAKSDFIQQTLDTELKSSQK